MFHSFRRCKPFLVVISLANAKTKKKQKHKKNIKIQAIISYKHTHTHTHTQRDRQTHKRTQFARYIHITNTFDKGQPTIPQTSF